MSSSRSSGSRRKDERSTRQDSIEFPYSSGGVSFRVEPPEQVSAGFVISPTVTVVRHVEAGTNADAPMIATLYLVDQYFRPMDATALVENSASGFLVAQSTGSGGGGGGGSSSRPRLTQEFQFPNLTIYLAGGPFSLQATVGQINYETAEYVNEGHAYSSPFYTV